MVYIDQFFAAYQISNCNPTYIPMIDSLYLVFAPNNCVPNPKEISVY